MDILELLVSLLQRLWAFIEGRLVLEPIVVNARVEMPPKSLSILDFLPFAGSLATALIAGYVAWKIYVNRARFDEWEKGRALRVAECDQYIELLTQMYPLVHRYDKLSAKMDSYYSADYRPLFAGSSHVGRVLLPEHQGASFKARSELGEINNELSSLARIYGVITEKDFLPHTRGLWSFAYEIRDWTTYVDLDWLNNARLLTPSWSGRMLKVINGCLDFERQEKRKLLSTSYTDDENRNQGVSARLAYDPGLIKREKEQRQLESTNDYGEQMKLIASLGYSVKDDANVTTEPPPGAVPPVINGADQSKAP